MSHEATLNTQKAIAAPNDSKGLYRKYRVERIDGKPLKGGMAIVLELGDYKTWPALAALADSVERAGNQGFAEHLRKLISLMRSSQAALPCPD